jgi:ketosteroid isomerase-like protein
MTQFTSARELFEAYKAEINKHDFDFLVPLLSNECTFWFSSGTYSGLKDSRAAFEKTWSMILDEVYSISDVKWIADSPTAAVCTYTFNWSGLINGQHGEGKGRGTSCFRQESTGWKIVHEHLSPFPK